MSCGFQTVWASYCLCCIYPKCCHKLHPLTPNICSNVIEQYFSNTSSPLMTPQYFLKITLAWNNTHLFIQLAGSFSVNQNICALLVGRLLSSSLSVFNVSSPVLSYTKGFDLTIIIRPLIPTKGGTGRKITWEGNYWFWCLRSVIHMLVIVMTKLEPIFSTCSLISSSKHAHP